MGSNIGVQVVSRRVDGRLANVDALLNDYFLLCG